MADEPLKGIDEDNIELVGNESALGTVEVDGLAGGDGGEDGRGGSRRRMGSFRNLVRGLYYMSGIALH